MTFEAELQAGDHWLIQVEQRGVDVVITVEDPEGGRLQTVDSPASRHGTESLLLAPRRSGRHRISVRCEKRGVPDGRYEILLERLSAETPTALRRLRAEAALSSATRAGRQSMEGAHEQSLAMLAQAKDTWQALSELRQEARTWLLIGSFHDRLERYSRAIASYRQALELWRRLEDLGAVAGALDRIGLSQTYLGEHAAAREALEEAVAVRQGLGQRLDAATSRGYLCLVDQRVGRWVAAGACYEQTLVEARELADRELEATLLNNLGGIFQNLGEPARQLEALRAALDLRRSLRDDMGEAITLNNLGAFHRQLGEIEAALLSFGQSLSIFERLGNRYWQARALNNIGYAYLRLGELERGDAYLGRSLALRRDVGDAAGETVTLLNLGRTQAALAKAGGNDEAADSAEAFFRAALGRSLAAGHPRSAVTARRLLGGLHLEQGRLTAARHELESALAGLHEMGNRRQEAEVLEMLARQSLSTGELAAAKRLAMQALELQRRVRDPMGAISVLTTLARIERGLGHPGASSELLDRAVEELEALHGRLGDPNLRASFLATQRQVHELRVALLMQRHRSSPSEGHHLAALEASERARSRSLLSLLGHAGLTPYASPDLAERLRNAERRLAAKSQRAREISGGEPATDEVLTAEQELYTALSTVENLRAEIRLNYPRPTALARPEALSAAGIGELLDEETVLLEFFLGEERSFLWWVTPTSVTAYELPPRRRIEELASQGHEQIGAIYQRRAEDRALLHRLGEMLLGPVAERLETQRLVVVADGALHFVPFAALTPPGSADPLLARHEMVFLPSASVLAAQRKALADPRKMALPAKTVAIFADPIFDALDPRLSAGSEDKAILSDVLGVGPIGGSAVTRSGLGKLARLPHTRLEAEAIAALVPPAQRFLALGRHARRSLTMDEELSAYRILHFATHGLVDPRTPELSGLALARYDEDGRELNGFLGFSEISNLDLSAELVVLSGCRTALGKQIRGEGLIGLTRAFLYAGVPRVVASSWQVRDRAAAELMARFYRAMLQEGRPPAAALRAAQLDLREDRRFRDPYYWAAFALQGDWR